MSEIDGQQIAFDAALEAVPTWQSLSRDLAIRVSGWRMNPGLSRRDSAGHVSELFAGILTVPWPLTQSAV